MMVNRRTPVASPDLAPAIHVLNVADVAKAWMPGTSPSMMRRRVYSMKSSILMACGMMMMSISAVAADTICRSDNRAERPCYSDAVALGWQASTRHGVEETGYLTVKTGGRTYTCVRFRDSRSGSVIEEGCDLTQMNLQDELLNRK